LTPVPGGVGPMTVAMLLANTVAAAREQAGGRGTSGGCSGGGRSSAPGGGRGGGRFVVPGELAPPRSADPGVVRRAARRLRGRVDAVNVTDNATARVGMPPLAPATLRPGEGLDPVLQLTCRDRNRLALTADLLGAHALGIRSVLCLSGDPMEVGATGAKPVFDLDAVGLARLATDLGQGHAPGGA